MSGLRDACGRAITYLRLSVTDRCNFRCLYCRPAGSLVSHRLREEILSFEEITSLAQVLVQAGVRRVRLTGGEPLQRRGLEDLIARLRELPGLDELALTTNGHGLASRALGLHQAGLSTVNVSLDSLDPVRFREITRGGGLATVVAGLEAATRVFRRVQTNTVPLEGVNDDELGAICRFAWHRRVVPRFIEQMPFSADGRVPPSRPVAAASVRARLLHDLGGTLEPVPDDDAAAGPQRPPRGPARYFRHSSGALVGLITPRSEPFCHRCNRVRLDARGRLHLCLAHGRVVDLRAALARGGPAAVAELVHHALASKPEGHAFAERAGPPSPKHMAAVGG